MKQIQQFGPGGETIMDYSIYDAVNAGFDKVVFVIRKDFAEEFKNIFEPKLKGKMDGIALRVPTPCRDCEPTPMHRWHKSFASVAPIAG